MLTPGTPQQVDLPDSGSSGQRDWRKTPFSSSFPFSEQEHWCAGEEWEPALGAAADKRVHTGSVVNRALLTGGRSPGMMDT